MEMAKNQGGTPLAPQMMENGMGGTPVIPGQMPPWLAQANAGMRANLGMEPGNPGSQIPGPPQPGTPMAAKPPMQTPQMQTPQMQNMGAALPQMIAQLMAKRGRGVSRRQGM